MTNRVVPALSSEQVKIGIEEMKARHGDPPWHEVLTLNDRYTVTVICQAPGHPNDWHYHLADECWFIYEGELSWTLEGREEPVRVTAGDWVLAPANTFHLIQVHGDRPAIRIAISHTGEYHRHDRADKPPAPAGARPD
ncbi:MAG TPA: cupin domain-containing protein [Thermomicrobiales bacterium]|nr:cupin domain-containing protein [Thermomicrobiales bacterium]